METWTAEQQQALRDRMKTYLGEHDLSANKAAKMIPCSMLSPWLNNDYTGDNEAVADKVAAWLARQDLDKTAMPRPDFVDTSISQRIHETLSYCHLEREMGVVVGYVGCGKTMAVDQYAEHEPGVVVLKLRDAHTPSRVIEDMARAAGVPHPRGTMHGLQSRTIERLRDTGRLLLVDEAQHLDRRGLEAIRSVHDEAHVGVAFVAMPRFYHGAINVGTEILAQIASRVGKIDVLPTPTVDDFEAMFTPRYQGLSRPVIERVHAFTGGDARKGDKLLKQAALLARAARRPVRTDDLAKAHAKLYSIDTQYRLQTDDHHPPALPAPAVPLRPAAMAGAR